MPETLVDRRAHWEAIYTAKADAGLSWHQPEPTRSLRWIRDVAPEPSARIVDVGAGRSRLVDRLLDAGYRAITLVDLSETALQETRARLGARGESVVFRTADLLAIDALGVFDLWHDRAVFHFLTAPEERARYRALLRRSLPPGGHVLLATFAPDGPTHCSGLPVCRYDAEALADELGPEFALLRAERELHATPWGALQAFTWACFRRR